MIVVIEKAVWISFHPQNKNPIHMKLHKNLNFDFEMAVLVLLIGRIRQDSTL